jgi:hypothetical protein
MPPELVYHGLKESDDEEEQMIKEKKRRKIVDTKKYRIFFL